MTHGHGFLFQLAPFQADESVGQGVALLGADVLADDFEQVGEGHHGTAHHIVELLFFLFGPAMAEGDVLQADGRGYLGGHTHFLPDAIHQVEFHLGEEDGKGNARESASRTEVHNGGARCELGIFGDAQRVEHVMLVQVGDVLARNHVDFRVPIHIEVIQRGKLRTLGLREGWEVFQYQFHNVQFFIHCPISS